MILHREIGYGINKYKYMIYFVKCLGIYIYL